MPEKQVPAESEDFQDPLQNYEPKEYSDPLEKALAEKSVAEIQFRPVAVATPDTPIHKAVEQLASLQVASLLIEEDGRLVGVFSDRDVLEKVALGYEQLKDNPVSEVMTKDPAFVYESDSSAAALCVMAVLGFRHVPVIDVKHKALGIISPQRVTAFLRKHLNG
ncbi:CBS domain-containing protein [Bythopirellula polymerisocia]|uniref:Arabinose 5-phosphate isomerase KdsD n=1 Tax=Bythopirellula polymerisocia TaxID=2528003 RepID=A0A5C6CYU6_9BACT|nr:CBS domain-containing protein [Bythopirellula polymerisocia]TWU29750.1 Arabinose 5-phosphate isomerase KdsD [Bythopirellula polymerisocia]